MAVDRASTPAAKPPATRSAKRCTGAARACAASTARTMSARAVAAPQRSTRTTMRPSQFTAPAATLLPAEESHMLRLQAQAASIDGVSSHAYQHSMAACAALPLILKAAALFKAAETQLLSSWV